MTHRYDAFFVTVETERGQAYADVWFAAKDNATDAEAIAKAELRFNRLFEDDNVSADEVDWTSMKIAEKRKEQKL